MVIGTTKSLFSFFANISVDKGKVAFLSIIDVTVMSSGHRQQVSVESPSG